MICKHCGTDIPDKSLYCLNCGSKIDPLAAENHKVAETPKPVKLVPGKLDLIIGSVSLILMLLQLLFCIVDFGLSPKRGLLYFSAIICLLCSIDCFFPELSNVFEALKTRRQGFDMRAYSQSKHFSIVRVTTHLVVVALALVFFFTSF